MDDKVKQYLQELADNQWSMHDVLVQRDQARAENVRLRLERNEAQYAAGLAADEARDEIARLSAMLERSQAMCDDLSRHRGKMERDNYRNALIRAVEIINSSSAAISSLTRTSSFVFTIEDFLEE